MCVHCAYRSIDAVAPIIHEWTYEAMIHDLVDLDGKLYKYDVTTQGGSTETKEAILDERDPMYVELRHLHFADALMKISERAEAFSNRNKEPSKMGQSDEQGKSMTTGQIRRVMENLPQYRFAPFHSTDAS